MLMRLGTPDRFHGHGRHWGAHACSHKEHVDGSPRDHKDESWRPARCAAAAPKKFLVMAKAHHGASAVVEALHAHPELCARGRVGLPGPRRTKGVAATPGPRRRARFRAVAAASGPKTRGCDRGDGARTSFGAWTTSGARTTSDPACAEVLANKLTTFLSTLEHAPTRRRLPSSLRVADRRAWEPAIVEGKSTRALRVRIATPHSARVTGSGHRSSDRRRSPPPRSAALPSAADPAIRRDPVISRDPENRIGPHTGVDGNFRENRIGPHTRGSSRPHIRGLTAILTPPLR